MFLAGKYRGDQKWVARTASSSSTRGRPTSSAPGDRRRQASGRGRVPPLHRRRVADRRGEARRHERRHPLHGRRPDGAPVPGASDHRRHAPAVRPVQAVGGREASRAGGAAGIEFILFGEWVYARHSVHYRRLPHYFFEFDIYDKRSQEFLSLETAAIAAGRGQASTPCR